MSRRDFLLHSTQALAVGTMPAWMRHSLAAESEGVGRVVTLGCSMALSGPLGAAGLEQVAGMKAAFHEINRSGGIHGREIALQVMDDAYVPARTLKNVTELVDAQSVFALISPMGTANTAALLPLIEGKGIPTVGPITGAPSVRSPEQRNLFFVRPSYADEARRLVQQMVDMGLRRIAVVYLDNPFGKEVLGYLSAALDEAQVERAGAFALAVDGKNGEEVAEKVYADRPGAVVLATTGTANTAFVLPFRARAKTVPLAGLSVTLFVSELPKLGDATRGMAAVQVFPDATSAKSVVVRKFQTSMKSAGAKPEYLTSGSSLEGWINAQVMIEGLRNAGKDLSRERLRAGLAGIRSLSFGDFHVGFGNKAPYVGSNTLYLAIYAETGRRVS